MMIFTEVVEIPVITTNNTHSWTTLTRDAFAESSTNLTAHSHILKSNL